MRLAVILIVVLLFGALINFLREGAGFPITQVLPLLGGHPPGMYDVAAGVMLLIAVWGFWRVARRKD